MPTDIAAERIRRLLRDGPLEVEGRLVDASNLVLRVWIDADDERIRAVYKPVRGESPLWDFPEGSLAGREYAAYLIAAAGGWDCVPVTVLRPDGPLGAGSVQEWVGPLDQSENDLLRIDPAAAVPSGFLPVLGLQDEDDQPMVVSHGAHPDLRAVALLDVVLNNADRKGSSLIIGDRGHLYAVDHGLTLHCEEKLRTVLWGFAGKPLTGREAAQLDTLRDALDGDLGEELLDVIRKEEVESLRERIETLQDRGRMPVPPADRRPLPWPLW